jgi:hypothetical protein
VTDGRMAAKNGFVSLKWLASLLEVLKLPVSEHELQLLFAGVLVWVDGSGCASHASYRKGPH